MSNDRGRPRFYADPIEFEERVDAYFKECKDDGRIPQLAGISHYLGFEDRDSFIRYQDYDGFSRIVKRARLRIESALVDTTLSRTTTPTGPIFVLKAHYGYTDQPAPEADSFAEFGKAVARALQSADEATAKADEPEAEDDAEVV